MQNMSWNSIYQRLLKFRILIHFILISIIVIASGAVIINSSGDALLEFRKISGIWSEPDMQILFKGDNIVLFNTVDYELLDDENREEKIQFELGINALYFYATNLNISVTDEQVNAKLVADRKINDYLAKREDFNEMLISLEMSEDEYWEWEKLFDITKKTLTVEKLLTQQRKIIEQENKNNLVIDISEELDKWRIDKIEEILDADNVKKIVN